jgi:hypothetical protein
MLTRLLLQSYIVAQVERFCALYNIRGLPDDGENLFATEDLTTQDAQDATAIAAQISVSPNGGIVGLPSYMESPAHGQGRRKGIGTRTTPKSKKGRKEAFSRT